MKYLDIEQWKNVEHKQYQLLPLSISKLQQAGWVLLWYRAHKEAAEEAGLVAVPLHMLVRLHSLPSGSHSSSY